MRWLKKIRQSRNFTDNIQKDKLKILDLVQSLKPGYALFNTFWIKRFLSLPSVMKMTTQRQWWRLHLLYQCKQSLKCTFHPAHWCVQLLEIHSTNSFPRSNRKLFQSAIDPGVWAGQRGWQFSFHRGSKDARQRVGVNENSAGCDANLSSQLSPHSIRVLSWFLKDVRKMQHKTHIKDAPPVFNLKRSLKRVERTVIVARFGVIARANVAWDGAGRQFKGLILQHHRPI